MKRWVYTRTASIFGDSAGGRVVVRSEGQPPQMAFRGLEGASISWGPGVPWHSRLPSRGEVLYQGLAGVYELLGPLAEVAPLRGAR